MYIRVRSTRSATTETTNTLTCTSSIDRTYFN
jgi:hypothetical protein